MLKDYIIKSLIKKNGKFRNIHRGETCIIMGNGASIKNINLSDLNKYPSISINLMVLHKDFSSLNHCAYVLPESYFFYKFFKNPYDKKFKENIIGNLFRRKIKEHRDINLFTSVTNYFGAPTSNTFYFHHFGKVTPDRNYVDLSGIFSMMAGGLYAALGVAVYLGFSRAILVGCDYLMSPREYGHFYSKPRLIQKKDATNAYPELLEEIKEFIDLQILGINSTSEWLDYVDYTNLSSKAIKYKENNEIVDEYSLLEMQRAFLDGQFPHKIIEK